MANSKQTDFDVIVIGAGISGINAGYRLQTQCPDRSYTILENRADMGGTWDLFKYPGIRSDSDLHTFGFPWRPWHEQEAIASGDLIKKYIRESAEEHGIDKNIRYQHKLISANWSTDQQKWTLEVEAGPEGKRKKKTFHAHFIILGTGYYDYEHALEATIPGLENFKGTVIHPQWWPEDLDYTDQKMVIIGSGATAVTLLPVLAQTAEHVTMLQRSPGYLISLPTVDPTGSVARKILPAWIANRLIRWKFLILPFIFFHFCRSFPNAARSVLKRVTSEQIPKDIPFDPHFNPSYNPWEQRLCVCPDGDFYKALREGKADIATGHIKTVTKDGIELQETGQKLDADIIITATGLKIQMAGGAQISVDGEQYNFGEHFVWRGVMLQDLPNAAIVIGYTNASWTLGADAAAQHVCRVLNSMKKNDQTSVIPTVDPNIEIHEQNVLNLNSTYVQRAKGKLPKAGDQAPWLARANYFSDIWEAKWGNITKGLQFFRVST